VNIPKRGEIIYHTEDMPHCPAIGCDGKITPRKSRFGKTFFSCSNFPDCDVISSALEDLPTKYVNYPKTAYVKKRGRGAKKGAAKGKKESSKRSFPDATPSPELAAIIGPQSLPRTQAVKKLWEYIKEHKLQDPSNKRKIVPDQKLAKVIGKNPVDMLKLAGLLSKHLKN
jgi:DNA topoisomerase-1